MKKQLCIILVLLWCGVNAQTLQLQNWTGANFTDGSGFFSFPPGVTTLRITLPLEAAWNMSGMYTTLGYYMPQTNDVCLVIPANYQYEYNIYPEGTIGPVSQSIQIAQGTEIFLAALALGAGLSVSILAYRKVKEGLNATSGD